MKFILSFLLFFTYSQFKAQQESKTSFEQIKLRLKTETDRQKIESCLTIARLPLPQDTILRYLDQATELAERIEFDSTYYIAFSKSVAYYHLAKFDQAIDAIRRAKSRVKYTDFPRANEARIHMMIATFHESLNRLDSASYYFAQTRKILKNDTAKHSLSVLSSTNTNEANMFFKQGDYPKALSIYLEAEKLSAKTGDYRNQVSSLYNAANCYLEMKKSDLAIHYYREAARIAKENKDEYLQGTALIGIGQTLFSLHKNQEAIKALLDAKSILEKTNQMEMLTSTYLTLATCYMADTIVDKVQQYMVLAKTGIAIAQDEYTRCNVYLNSSILFRMQRRFSLAFEELKMAEGIALSNDYLKLQIDCLQEKINLLQATKDYQTSAAVYQELILLKDSLLNTENLKAISEVETKYQTERKEKQNLVLQAKNARQTLLLEKENKRKWMLYIGIITSLLILGVVTFYYRQVKKQKQNVETQKNRIEKQKTHIEEQKRSIEHLHREMHHRMKNNLSMIDVLIENVKDELDDSKASSRLEVLQDRINSFNEVHLQLYNNTDVNKIELPDFVSKLGSRIQHSFSKEKVNIEYDICRDIDFPVQKSFPLGLIINEFLTNSFKYAFPNKQEAGQVTISIAEDDDDFFLSMADNGIGFSDNFDVSKVESFGMVVMKLLSQQLQGSMAISGTQGVKLTIQFPKT